MFPEPSPLNDIWAAISTSRLGELCCSGERTMPRTTALARTLRRAGAGDVYYWEVSASRFIEYLFRLVNNILTSEG
jgi:hypothetical protein